MTNYEDVFNSEDAIEQTLSPEEAIGAIALITASAATSEDFELDIAILADLLWELEIFAEYSEDEMAALVTRLTDVASGATLGGLFNAAYEGLSEDTALDAFAGAVIVLTSDEGEVSDKGKKFLEELQVALEIDNEEAQEIINEVIESFAEEEYEESFEPGEESYESPAGNFTVPIPVDLQKGGRVSSQPGIVAFSDDFGTLLRIDYFQMQDREVEEKKIADIGRETYLKTLLNDYVSQGIIASIPNSQVLHEEYLEDTVEGSYFVVVDMPQGSTISIEKNEQDPVRLDAYRGITAFSKDNYLYIVSCQRSFFEDEEPGEIDEEVEELKDQLDEFIETIEFAAT